MLTVSAGMLLVQFNSAKECVDQQDGLSASHPSDTFSNPSLHPIASLQHHILSLPNKEGTNANSDVQISTTAKRPRPTEQDATNHQSSHIDAPAAKRIKDILSLIKKTWGKPTHAWEDNSYIDLEGKAVYYYNSKNADDIGKKDLPREILDIIVGFMDPDKVTIIFVKKSMFAMKREDMANRISVVGVKQVLINKDVSAWVLATDDTPGLLDPYQVFRLVSGTGCQECEKHARADTTLTIHTGTRNVNWIYCRRICGDCFVAHRLWVCHLLIPLPQQH